MAFIRPTFREREQLEARILAAALKQSLDRSDSESAMLAHKELSQLLKLRREAANYQRSVDGDITATTPSEASIVVWEAAAQASPKNSLPSTAIAHAGFAADSPEPQSKGLDTESLEGANVPQQQQLAEFAPCGPDYYSLLGANTLSTYEQIHIAFLRKVRALLSDCALSGSSVQFRAIRDKLRQLCVAHDVLRDAVTRTDYDLKAMGMRAPVTAAVSSDAKPIGIGSRIGLRIGELLQCAQLIDATELEIAVDMHKAMPEMPFGQFLLKQGFINERELESALLGQRLILEGKITVAQFQAGMHAVGKSFTHLSDSLTSSGWVTTEDLEQKPQTSEPLTPCQIREIAVSGPKVESGAISANNAVPDWASQIIWEAAEESDTEKDPPGLERPAPPQAGVSTGEQSGETVVAAPEPHSDEAAAAGEE